MNAFPRVPLTGRHGFVLPGSVKMLHAIFVSQAAGLVALLLFLIGSVPIHAQSSRAAVTAQPLVVQPVDESRRVTLSGNVHPFARHAGTGGVVDRGAVDPGTPASRMFLVLQRSPEREAALTVAIEALHDRNSASFHQWMTPEQFGAQWGATDSDLAAATAWLQSHGFTVTGPTKGRTMIEFSGTAGQVEAAFHTSIHAFAVNGETHYANIADPQIPEALAPLVAGITTLNDFHPRAMVRKGPRGIYNAEKHRIEPERAQAGGIRPELTASGSFGDFLYVGPADAATIYNAPNHALNPAATGATIDGAGAKIGIVGDSNISGKQLANYRTLFGLAPVTVAAILDGTANPGENSDAVEAYLDTEVANGIAPGAKVFYYEAADTNVNFGVDLASSRAVNDNVVDVLNLSFGECEAQLGRAANAFYAGLWKQAAAQGISVTVSAGDAGSAGCDDPDTQTVAYYGLQVNGLASTPYNIAVGGTDFAALAGPDGSGTDFTNYVSATSDPTTLRSALGAIPEVPWNDAIASFPPTTIDASIPFTTPYADIVAGGGGKSACLVNTTTANGYLCLQGYGKPAWQAVPGVPSDGARDVPDLSLFAANGLDYAAWGICTDQDTDSVGNPIEDCTLGSNGLPANEFYIYGVGGTSASAPAMAGVLALVRQKTGERQGLANYTFYHLARTQPSIFHDVTTGNNSVPCASGSANCATNGQGAELVTGYNAGAGYDLASGLGSVDISALLANWTSVGLASSATQLTLSPSSIEHGQTVDANVTVTASSGTATGQVALSANANPPSLAVGASIGSYPLKTGGSTGTLAINSLPGGSYKVFATYGGSAAVGESVSAPVSVTVTPETSSTLVTMLSYRPATLYATASSTVPYGYQSVIAATPYGNRSPVQNGKPQPDGIATGTVSFTEGTANLGVLPVGLDGTAEVQGSFLEPGSYTIQAAYHGDNSFDASTGTYPLTITKGATTTTLAANASKFTGQPITFTITVDTQSAAVAPAGTVALRFQSKVLATAHLTGTSGSANAVATGTATIKTANLPPGNLQLEAVYSGEVHYAGSTSNTVAIAGKPAFAIANISMSLPGEHTTGAALLTVTSEAGYAGTVNFSCALVSANKAAAPPECGLDPGSATLAVNGSAQPLLLIFGKGTKLPKGITAGDAEPAHAGLGMGLGVGGAVVMLLLLGIPARRRGWRAMLPVLLLLAIFTGMTACTTSAKLITAGNYKFTVTGVDSKDSTIKTTATISVRVL